MKHIVLLAVSCLVLAACGQANESAATSAKKDEAEAPASASSASASSASGGPAAGGDVCSRYFAFVEDYAGKQQAAVKDTLLKRLDYDKQSLPTRDKAEADAYCTQSLERMERMAG